MDPTLKDILEEIRQLRRDLLVSKKQMISVKELAQQLGCAPKTIRNQLSLGTFPIQVVRSSAGLRFRQEDVDWYIQEELADG